MQRVVANRPPPLGRLMRTSSHISVACPSLLTKLEQSKRGSSVLPILTQWLAQGNTLSRDSLYTSIGRLRFLGRQKDALEILEWMMISGNRELRLADYATYLDLIAKVRGLGAAANYFESVPHHFRQTDTLHKTLFKNYLFQNAVYKARQLLKKMTELGFVKSPSMYNQVISLYLRKQKENRIPELLLEMKDAGISPDVDTYNIMMETRSKKGDVFGMERMFERMQASSGINPNAATYLNLTSTYISAGLHDKAEALFKNIGDVDTLAKAPEIQDALILLYARLGKVEEMHKLQKSIGFGRMSQSSYKTIMEALCKAGQLETVEELFLEIGREGSLEVRLANDVINMLTMSGHLERAEKLFQNMLDMGCLPNSYTYHHFVTGYLQNNQPENAIKKLEQCQEFKTFQRIVPLFETMLVILNLHADRGDVKSAEKLFQNIKRYNYAQNVKVYNALLRGYLKNKMDAYEVTNLMALDQVAPNQDTVALFEQFKMLSNIKSPISNIL